MNLPAYYTCPAGHTVAVIRDSLNDAPETWPVAERSIFERCNYCEEVVEDGVCVLRYEVHA